MVARSITGGSSLKSRLVLDCAILVNVIPDTHIMSVVGHKNRIKARWPGNACCAFTAGGPDVPASLSPNVPAHHTCPSLPTTGGGVPFTVKRGPKSEIFLMIHHRDGDAQAHYSSTPHRTQKGMPSIPSSKPHIITLRLSYGRTSDDIRRHLERSPASKQQNKIPSAQTLSRSPIQKYKSTRIEPDADAR